MKKLFRPLGPHANIMSLSTNTHHTLPLQDNSLTHIPYAAFPSQLTELIFNYNEITYIHNDAFTSNNLTFLDLSHNLLHTISNFTLPSTLTRYYVHNNPITKVSQLQFTNSSTPASLVELNLSNNPISNISTDAFTNLVHLDYLKLFNTPLTSFDNISLPSSLTRLELPNNRLTSIDHIQLPSLTILQLANNPISNITNNVFPASLSWLDLSNTSMTSLPTALTPLDRLEQLDLRGNPDLNCSCEPSIVSWYHNLILGPSVIYGGCAHVGQNISYFLSKCPTSEQDGHFY